MGAQKAADGRLLQQSRHARSLARANSYPNATSGANVPPIGAQSKQDSKPKMIKLEDLNQLLAQQHEIMGLRDKKVSEAKAKRLGAQKASDHKLPMEILGAE